MTVAVVVGGEEVAVPGESEQAPRGAVRGCW